MPVTSRRSSSAGASQIGRITAVPDRLEVVSDAFGTGLDRADLVVSTGGLGPTPDDLTREAIAAVLGETVAVDPDLEAWLRELWKRRGMDMPDMNLKQAWLIPSATAIPNANGTAPGWWVDAPGGGVIVALPGPPREMRPMWRDWVLPRLEARGLGRDFLARTYRLTGIGESAVADVLGEELLRRPNPEVATYARVEAVDVRIAAFGESGSNGAAGATAAELVAAAEEVVLDKLGVVRLGPRRRELGGRHRATPGGARLEPLDGRGMRRAPVSWRSSAISHGCGSREVLAGTDVAGLARARRTSTTKRG